MNQDLKTSPRGDVERLCGHLADKIEANGSKRPAVTKGWRDTCRLMLDADGRSEDQALKIIDWCQNDGFWRTTILSMTAFRKQYDKLRLQAERDNGNHRNGHTPTSWQEAYSEEDHDDEWPTAQPA